MARQEVGSRHFKLLLWQSHCRAVLLRILAHAHQWPAFSSSCSTLRQRSYQCFALCANLQTLTEVEDERAEGKIAREGFDRLDGFRAESRPCGAIGAPNVFCQSRLANSHSTTDENKTMSSIKQALNFLSIVLQCKWKHASLHRPPLQLEGVCVCSSSVSKEIRQSALH